MCRGCRARNPIIRSKKQKTLHETVEFFSSETELVYQVRFGPFYYYQKQRATSGFRAHGVEKVEERNSCETHIFQSHCNTKSSLNSSAEISAVMLKCIICLQRYRQLKKTLQTKCNHLESKMNVIRSKALDLNTTSAANQSFRGYF